MNRKCVELQEYVSNFRHIIVTDECSMDALACEIQHKIKELNEKYPKTKELIYRTSMGFIGANVAGEVDKYAFSLGFTKIRATYRFSENCSRLKALEGGEL